MRKPALAAIGLLVLAASASPTLAADPSVTIASKEGIGSYLADGAGKTLYWYTKDSPGTSACEGPCLGRWPAFLAGDTTLPAALKPEDFGTITRRDGAKQTTFRGYPLYFWIGDASPGDTRGQGVNDVWYVVDPAAFPPKAAP